MLRGCDQRHMSRCERAVTVALWLMAIAWVARSLWFVEREFVPDYVFVPLVSLSMLSFFAAVWYGRGMTLFAHGFPRYFLLLYTVYMLWSAAIIVRSVKPEYYVIREIFADPYNAWAWLVPVTVFLGTRLNVWRCICKIGLVHSELALFVALPSGLLFLGIIYEFRLTYLAPFLLLISEYFDLKTKVIVCMSVVLQIVSNMSGGSRTSVVGSGLFVLAFLVVGRPTQQCGTGYGRLAKAAMFALLIVMSLWVLGAQNLGISFLPEGANVKLESFRAKLSVDSRTAADIQLFDYFWKDVKGIDRWFGRGCTGRYRAIGYEDRSAIESGYLHMILKGGYVELVLFLLVVVPAIFSGFFCSRNVFSRACSSLVVIRLLTMFTFGLPAVRLDYVLFWLSIGVLWSRRIRQMSDAVLWKAIGV